MQAVYINGSARIGADLNHSIASDSAKIKEPDYTQYIDKRKLRRLDQLSRFGLHTTYAAMEEAGCEKIDGVIMGVGQTISQTIDGMLRKMIAQNEGLTNPTSFMNSLLSTAAGQIALQLKCNGYSNTHTQRGFSTEAALLDAALQLQMKPSQNIVVGGMDITHESYKGLSEKYGHFAVDTTTEVERSIGEGAAIFLVSGQKSDQTKACISEVYTAFLTEDAISNWSAKTLQETLFGGDPPTVDMILSGRPKGNEAHKCYADILAAFDRSTPVLEYKTGIGEFPTASAHGLYLAVEKIAASNSGETPPERVLVINNFGERYLSAFLVTRP